jgi:putative transposase
LPPKQLTDEHSDATGQGSVNVKNWQNGTMALRWCAAGMIEAGKQFRRVNGHLHLPGLRVALDAYVAAQTVGAIRHDEPVIAA